MAVDCEGCNEGIVIMWKEEVEFEIINYLKNHIHRVFCSWCAEREFFLAGCMAPRRIQSAWVLEFVEIPKN